MVVLLPAPFGPRNPVTLPGSTANVRLSTASLSPYLLVRPRTSIIKIPFVPLSARICIHRKHARS